VNRRNGIASKNAWSFDPNYTTTAVKRWTKTAMTARNRNSTNGQMNGPQTDAAFIGRPMRRIAGQARHRAGQHAELKPASHRAAGCEMPAPLDLEVRQSSASLFIRKRKKMTSSVCLPFADS